MKNPVLILSVIALITSGCGQARKAKTTNAPAISIESFIGEWLREEYMDVEVRTDEQRLNDEEGIIEKDVLVYSLKLILEKDGTKENALKGWHCASIRGGAQVDCDDDDTRPIRGYLRNDTVYLHFVNNWDDAVEAKLYFDQSAQDLSTVTWELIGYEPKLVPFFANNDTLQRQSHIDM